MCATKLELPDQKGIIEDVYDLFRTRERCDRVSIGFMADGQAMGHVCGILIKRDFAPPPLVSW